jgi:hypothetical protein
MSVLETLDFQPMLITDVFESMAASKAWYDKSKLCLSGVPVFPFVSRTKASNGVDSFCPRQDKAPEAGNAMTIGLDTQTIGYQPVPFYTSQNIQVLRHERLNESNALVLSSLIQEQMGKFSWGGNGATLGRLKKTRIMVPALTTADGTFEADWDGMDRLGAELLERVVTHAHSARATRLDDDDTLAELRFAPIRLDALFRFYRGAVGKRVTGGRTVYIGAAARRNSVVGYVNDDPMFPGGRLAIVNNGDGGAGYCTYQPMPFSASSDVTVLEPLENNIPGDALLLLSSCITYQCFPKYSFGYKPNQRRLAAQEIMVPVVTNASGEDVVDWEGMASYGRALRVRAERAIVPVVGSLS